jgi:hypothetical protein
MVFSFHWYERIKGIVTMLIIQNPPRPPFSKGGLGRITDNLVTAFLLDFRGKHFSP